MVDLLAVDVGNTSAKWGLFRGEELAWAERSLDVTVPDAARTALDRQPCHVVLASVNGARADAVRSQVAKHYTGSVRVVGEDVGVSVVNRAARPEQTGVDRLLGVLAVTHIKETDRPAIVVDCGSAITVNAVSADGALLGGAILPGLALAASALHDRTDALPLVDPARPTGVLGTTTEDAIRVGLVLGCAGAVDRLVRETAGCLRGDAQLFLTGSDAPLVGRYLSLPIRHVPHLTLWGIYHACRTAVCG